MAVESDRIDGDGILDALAGGVVALNAAGKITAFNRTAEATFGVEAHRFTGTDAAALTPLIPEFTELLYTFLANGAVSLRAEVQGIHRRDGSRTLELRFAPLADTDGTGVVILILDRTAQRSLEHAHEMQLARTRAIEDSFGRYLAPHVVASLIRDPTSVRLGGVRQRATMLFADVRGFTALANARSPEEVVALLNVYFESAVGAIFAGDGLLDKFYGDGLMAVFGLPVARDDDQRRAIAAAFALQGVVADIQPQLESPLEISIGLATGDVFAGHIGSPRRMDYTVIGDAVNLARGLQLAAPPGAIYCDVATYEAAGLAGAATRIATKLKGRDELVTAYALRLV
ncbi:MAG: adenylate/guanylate cyclase domain-containing protein [Vulcanimicrobiaceae bacterium]